MSLSFFATQSGELELEAPGAGRSQDKLDEELQVKGGKALAVR